MKKGFAFFFLWFFSMHGSLKIGKTLKFHFTTVLKYFKSATLLRLLKKQQIYLN